MNIKKIIIPLLINFFFTIGYSKDIVSFDTALAIAKKTNRPVLIDIFSDWWFPCWKFDRASKNDKEIRSVVENVVLLKLNKKETEAGNIIEKYGNPEGFPTFIMISQNGDLKESWSGYSKDSFLTKTNKLLNLKN